ncbi:hypothetical protein IBX65_07045 [Candidatus Aerophobetes bacterium]|nr:hypothetical protein [Candidatus Aerophobetes bacterium]
MFLFFLVYEEVLDGEVSSLLDKLKPDRYIKWDKVTGEWKEKHMGTHIWPGEYNTVVAMLKEEEVEKLKGEVLRLRKKFPADELWGWTVILNEVI